MRPKKQTWVEVVFELAVLAVIFYFLGWVLPMLQANFEENFSKTVPPILEPIVTYIKNY